MFPENEQRQWKKIESTYNKGIEKFYKIILNNMTIGFFMLEKLNGKYPFYLDYFAIFEEYQKQGYGTEAIDILKEKIAINSGIIGEIEKENIENKITIQRFKFYEKLGFRKVESEYLLYNVLYTPIECCKNCKIDKEEFDKIFFDYYTFNCRRK